MLTNMETLLKVAKENRFAVPAFNISSLEMMKAVIEKAEELQAPVILEIHPDELSYLGDNLVQAVRTAAVLAKIPVVLHLDHGGSINDIMRAVRNGFTSVMFDGSRLTYEENVRITQETVRLARPLGISVEAELGTIGNTGTSSETAGADIIYTDIDQAIDFVEKTKIDTLAVAIGTAHGLYPKDRTPELNLELLAQIQQVINKPLVLHGGSGNSDKEVAASVGLGIAKVNISSDIKSAFFNKMKEVLAENPSYEPNQINPVCMEAVQKVVAHKLELLQTVHKSNLYS